MKDVSPYQDFALKSISKDKHNLIISAAHIERVLQLEIVGKDLECPCGDDGGGMCLQLFYLLYVVVQCHQHHIPPIFHEHISHLQHALQGFETISQQQFASFHI